MWIVALEPTTTTNQQRRRRSTIDKTAGFFVLNPLQCQVHTRLQAYTRTRKPVVRESVAWLNFLLFLCLCGRHSKLPTGCISLADLRNQPNQRLLLCNFKIPNFSSGCVGGSRPLLKRGRRMRLLRFIASTLGVQG